MKKLSKKTNNSFNSVETYAARWTCTCACYNCDPSSFLYTGSAIGAAILHG